MLASKLGVIGNKCLPRGAYYDIYKRRYVKPGERVWNIWKYKHATNDKQSAKFLLKKLGLLKKHE